MTLPNNLFSIAIDCGKFNTKAIFENQGLREKLIFRTTMRNGNDVMQFLDNIHCVAFKGEKYVIGDSSDELREENLNLDKNSKLHEIATLTMICKALKHCQIKSSNGSNLKINLSINIPLSHFLRAEKKAEIESLYANKEIYMIFDGEEFVFKINNVLVLFEGAGALIQYSEYLSNKNVYLIDCGGLNITRLALIDGKIDTSTLKTDPHGCNAVIHDIIDKVKSRYDRKLLSSDVMKVLKGEKTIEGKDSEAINELINTTFEKFVETSATAIKKDVDYHSFEFFMLGGSSEFYYPAFSSQLAKSIKLSQNPIFDNVEGFYQTMKIKGLA